MPAGGVLNFVVSDESQVAGRKKPS